jgi:hypothetical protein
MQAINISQAIDQLQGDFAADQPVMLWGPPGCAKSAGVCQAAARYWRAANDAGAVVSPGMGAPEISDAVPVIDVRLSQLEPSDLRGIPYPDSEGTRTVNLLPDWLPTEAVDFGVIFLDEITSAPHSVAAAAFQLVLDRKLGTYTVPAGWRFVAAGNRLSDRGVVNPMPSPLANRFAHYEIMPHAETWLLWAAGAGIDARVNTSLFNLDVTQGDIRAFASPRSWAFLSNRLRVAGAGADIFTTAAAYVGEAAAADFCAVLPVLDQLPSLPEITADPIGCRVPDPTGGNVSALAACFAAGNMIAAAVANDTDLLDVVYPYLERLPLRETIPAAMATIIRELGGDKSKLVGSAAYRKFALEFADMLID